MRTFFSRVEALNSAAQINEINRAGSPRPPRAEQGAPRGAARTTEQQYRVCLSIFRSKPSAKQRFCSRRCWGLSQHRGGIVPSEARAEGGDRPRDPRACLVFAMAAE